MPMDADELKQWLIETCEPITDEAADQNFVRAKHGCNQSINQSINF